MRQPTARQLAIEAAVDRHGGRSVSGAQSKAARELGISQGAIHSALRGLDQHRSGAHATIRRPKLAREIVDSLPGRLDAIDAVQAEILAGMARLERKIDGFVGRQPILLEVRPRHDRKVDGGIGGVQEVRRTTRAARGAVA